MEKIVSMIYAQFIEQKLEMSEYYQYNVESVELVYRRNLEICSKCGSNWIQHRLVYSENQANTNFKKVMAELMTQKPTIIPPLS